MWPRGSGFGCCGAGRAPEMRVGSFGMVRMDRERR